MHKAIPFGALVAGVALTACSPGATSPGPSSSATKIANVTLVTHDSWVAPKELLAEFTKQTGYSVKVAASGDAGQLANSVVLTKDKPTGDVVFGIDNTFASRVADAGALAAYTSAKLPASAAQYAVKAGAAAKALTPIDFGDSCVNVDNAWFKTHGQQPPSSLDDLIKPAYKNLFVTPGAATSSPGMAFLLTTIAKYGDSGWEKYWRELGQNGAKITNGWSDAWNVDYTAGGGKGTRPIVLSYNTSPADTIKSGKATTSALMDTCFRQVEYAGVLNGATNVPGAKAFIDFMLGKSFQSALPVNMYAFPVDSSVPLPADWKAAVQTPAKPWSVDPAQVTAHRDGWLQDWQDATAS